jgi:hypothetical protein
MALLSTVQIQDLIANIPAAGVEGRTFWPTDEDAIYYDNGTTWDQYFFGDGHSHSNKAVLDATTASYTTAEETKLAGVEAGATADQTGAEIKAAYEGEADTNAFTDAEKTKLAGIAAGATVDQVIPYDFGVYYPDQPTSSQVLNKLVFPRAASTADDFAGSYGHVDTNPTAQFDVDVQVEGVSVGTVSVSTGGVFTFTTSGGALSISAGERLEFIAPASTDATIAGLSFTIVAEVD